MDAPTTPPLAYHEKLPQYPEFEIVSDTIDGIIPSCHVKSWREFEEILTQEQHNRLSGEMIYRGQRDHRWPLASTLGRWFGEGGIDKSVAESLLTQFRLAMRGRGTNLTTLSDDEVWAYGQHYELATPLLDWTKSPFVALYFAFLREDDGKDGNTSRAIFCLNMTKICEVLDDIILEPQHNENARLVNQAGLFTKSPYGNENLTSKIIDALREEGQIDPDNANELANYIYKIHIPNEGRDECLAMLQKMNIHDANLFPDPGGASRFTNNWLSRLFAEQKAESAKLREAEASQKSKEILSKLSLQEGENVDLIEELLQSILPAAVSGDAASYAEKINNRYREVSSIDWPDRPSATSKIKIELTRLLKVADYPSELISTTIDQMIDLLGNLYKQRRDSV